MKNSWLIGMLFLFTLSACQTATEEPPPTTPASESEDVAPQSTDQPDDELDKVPATVPPAGYPAPAIAPTTAPSEGYPAPPTLAPPLEAYPAEASIWMLLPVGEQCAEADGNGYADLQEAVAALEAAGVPVDAAEMTELVVCQACGCPTSAHYRVQISAENLDRATALGWLVESEG
jgi:hypothetical protein